MEASPKPTLHLVDGNGQATEVCARCAVKDQAIEDLTRTYRGKIQRLKEVIVGLRDDRDADLPYDEAADAVMRRWHELALASRWFGRPPATGPTSTRWRDTKRALHGTKTKSGDQDWPPRSVADLLVASTGAFIRGEAQRHDRGFKRDFLDPCTAFFTNFDRNFEAASDPAPKQVGVALFFEAPPVLWDRWQQVVDLADPCDHCDHLRLDHDRPSLVTTTGFGWGECRVHGCHCTEFDDFWFQSERWLNRNGRGQG